MGTYFRKSGPVFSILVIGIGSIVLVDSGYPGVLKETNNFYY